MNECSSAEELNYRFAPFVFNYLSTNNTRIGSLYKKNLQLFQNWLYDTNVFWFRNNVPIDIK